MLASTHVVLSRGQVVRLASQLLMQCLWKRWPHLPTTSGQWPRSSRSCSAVMFLGSSCFLLWHSMHGSAKSLRQIEHVDEPSNAHTATDDQCVISKSGFVPSKPLSPSILHNNNNNDKKINEKTQRKKKSVDDWFHEMSAGKEQVSAPAAGESVGPESLVSALGGDQLRAWRKQREQLRSNFRQLWGVAGDQFRTLWTGEQRAVVRMAMLLAAKEEVESGSQHLAALLETLLPELFVLLEGLLQEVDAAEKQTKGDPKEDGDEKEEEKKETPTVDLCSLMADAAERRDVETTHFSVANIDAFVETLCPDDTDARQTAREALLVGRSCLLLQLSTCMLLLVMAEAPDETSKPSSPIL